LFWSIFLRKTEWVLRNFWFCGGFSVEEPNGCKFIEKILGLFWVDHYALWFHCCISIFSFSLLVIEGLRRAFSGRTRPEESQRTTK